MQNREQAAFTDANGTWDDAQAALQEFREKIEELGSDYAAIGAVSHTTMSVTSATATPNDDLIVSVQFVVAMMECLRRSRGWNTPQMMTVLARAVECLTPGEDSEASSSGFLS